MKPGPLAHSASGVIGIACLLHLVHTPLQLPCICSKSNPWLPHQVPVPIQSTHNGTARTSTEQRVVARLGKHARPRSLKIETKNITAAQPTVSNVTHPSPCENLTCCETALASLHALLHPRVHMLSAPAAGQPSLAALRLRSQQQTCPACSYGPVLLAPLPVLHHVGCSHGGPDARHRSLQVLLEHRLLGEVLSRYDSSAGRFRTSHIGLLTQFP